MQRRQHTGIDAVETALRQGPVLRLVLMRRDADDPRLAVLREACEAAGVVVRESSANDLRRMRVGSEEVDALGLSGPDPKAAPAEWLAERSMPAWLLTGIAYPGNAGYAIRCAEVSGASGIAFDVDFAREMREQAYRTSMGADRFLPVWWAEAGEVLATARAAGRRIVVVEDCGTRAPWQMDLTLPALYVVGGEDQGVPRELVDAADELLRLPMAGFVPSYNLQAAMAMVAGEILRQGEGQA